MNHLPPSPENNIRVISNFFEKISEIFVSQGAPPVSTKPSANFATGTAGVFATSDKFATMSTYRWQICRLYQQYQQ
jgi:hypothetical protein